MVPSMDEAQPLAATSSLPYVEGGGVDVSECPGLLDVVDGHIAWPSVQVYQRQEKYTGRFRAERPHLRTNAFADLDDIASLYGSDLVHPPDDWLDVDKCESVLARWQVARMPCFLLELFAVCARLSNVA